MRAVRQERIPATNQDLASALTAAVDRHPIAAAMLVVLANLALKLPTIGTDSLWLDEAVSLQLALEPISLRALAAQDATPPLHYLLLGAWGRIFGVSLEGSRALSVLLSAATAGVLFDLARRHLGAATALISAALFLVSGLQLYFAHEVRCYALVGFLCAVSFHLFLGLFERPSWRRAAVLGVVNAALAYTHSVAIFALVAQLVAGLSVARQRRDSFVRYAASQLLALVLFLPWIVLIAQSGVPQQISWIQPPSVGQIRYILKRFAGSSTLLVLYACIAVAALVLHLTRPRGDRPAPFALRVIMLWTFLPLALAYAVSRFQPMLLDRYVLYASLGLYLLIAYAIATAPLAAKARSALATALIVLAAIASFTEPIRRQDWRRAAAIASEEQRERGASIVVARGVHYRPLAYYLDPEGFFDPPHTLGRLADRGVGFANELRDFEDLATRPARYVLLLGPDSPLPAKDAPAWWEAHGMSVARVEDLNGLGLLVLAPRSSG